MASVRGAKLTFHRKSQEISYYPIGKETDTLLLFSQRKWERIPLFIVNAPEPQFYWGTNRTGKIPKEQLLKNEGLIITNDSIPFQFYFHIYAFKALIIKQSDTLLFKRCETDSMEEYPFGEVEPEDPEVYQKLYGNSFAACLRPQLEQLNAGDIIWIPIINVGCSSCISRRLPVNIKLMIE